MSSTITSASPPTHELTPAASGPKGAPSAASGKAAPSAQQTAALKQLQAQYAMDQSRGVAASTLSSLGKQIMAMANTLGQHVTLPRGSSSSAAASAAPVASASQGTNKVDVKA